MKNTRHCELSMVRCEDQTLGFTSRRSRVSRVVTGALASISTCLLLGCNPATQETISEPMMSAAATDSQPYLSFQVSGDDALTLNSDGAVYSLEEIDNESVLALTFPSNEHMPSLVLSNPSSWDFTSYPESNLAFNVQNTSDTSVHLYVDLLDEKHVLQRHAVAIPQGFDGVMYFPVSGVEAESQIGFWGDPPSWDSDELRMIWRSWKPLESNLQRVNGLRLLTIGNVTSKSLTVSNFRLRKNPDINPNWLTNLVDEFGQSTRVDSSVVVKSEAQLKQWAEEELASLSGEPWQERSQYGGWKDGPKLEATGYFRTTKLNGQWWMVDPEGYLFFSHGPANVRMANTTTYTGIDYNNDDIRRVDSGELTPEDSLGIVQISDEIKQGAQVAYPQRHGMFSWLPEYDSPLAKHYSYRRTSHKGPIESGETYSFYRANLERRYGEDYLDVWRDTTLNRMHDWGFTSFGNWVDPAFYQADQVPYFANGWIIGDFKTLSGEVNHWGEMPDPFDPAFAARAKLTIDKIAKEVRHSPWCAGIFVDNEKSWGEREGSVSARYGVILDALSKSSEESPAKAAFTDLLEAKYSNISALNAAWNTSFADWRSLSLGATFASHTDAQVKDYSYLLEQLGEQYFKVVHNTLEAALPNHLYMGARMANWGMPDEIIKASLKYSDVLSFNIYEEGMQPHFWSFLEDVDLPVVVGEFHIGTATDSGMYNPGIVHASDQADRARMYTQYMETVLSKPYMVGAHWFQYIDEPITGRAHDGENANIGMVTVADVPYPELVSAMKAFNKKLYQSRFDQTKN